ncbi:MAG: DNA gyrase inhibitor YacG [Sandaracinaceae bacterium]|nr:DNA gyrase inhibitor YacG [Sandaracinaceae bacterium]
MRAFYPCPICGQPTLRPSSQEEWKKSHFPFCSQRCRTIDLGAWLSESYRIREPIAQDKETPDLPKESS